MPLATSTPNPAVAIPAPATPAIRLWLPLTALPYFCLYARDLQLAGYRASDFVRVYSLNLVLIPINLGGVLKSLHHLRLNYNQ